MDSSQIDTVAQRGRIGGVEPSARKRFVIAMREPWHLPEDKIELPSPKPVEGNPPTLNLISAILPPIMMVLVVFIYSRISPTADMRLMILMPMMSMAFPIGNIASYYFQKKDFKKKLAIREQTYRNALLKTLERRDGQGAEQRQIL